MDAPALESHDATALASPPVPAWAALYDEGRQLDNKPFRSVCYAPFTTLDFGPTGDVAVCCANTTHIVGNVRTQSLHEIWTGPAMQTIRSAFRNYQFVQGCNKCIQQVNRGDLRTTFSKKDDVYALDQSWERGPVRMDFRLANTCNLACIMCCGECSSTIRRDVDHLPLLDCSYPERFFEELEAYLPYLQHAGFTGGEPFLVQNNYRVWDLIIQHAGHIKCRITTNGTVLTDKVRHYLERLQLADLCVSIDGATKETFEFVRRGASFERVLDHLGYFSDYCRRTGTNLRFNVCGLAANWRELPEIYLLAKRYGATVWTNIVTPSSGWLTDRAVSMLEMPEQEQREAAAYLAQRFEEIKDALDGESQANYQVQVNVLRGPVVVPGVTTGARNSAW